MLQTKNFEWSPRTKSFLAHASDLLKKEPTFRKILDEDFRQGIYLYGTESKKKCYYTLDKIERYDGEIFCWWFRPESRIGAGTTIKIFNS